MCSKIRKKVGISMSCIKHERYQTIQTTKKKISPKNIDLILRKIAIFCRFYFTIVIILWLYTYMQCMDDHMRCGSMLMIFSTKNPCAYSTGLVEVVYSCVGGHLVYDDDMSTTAVNNDVE